MKPSKLLDIATGVAISRIGINPSWRLGAVGVRKDGVLVASFNGTAPEPEWTAHAESRLCRKLTPDSLVAVVRVHANGHWALARPCKNCRICLARMGVKKVYYSIAPGEYGVLTLSLNNFKRDELSDKVIKWSISDGR